LKDVSGLFSRCWKAYIVFVTFIDGSIAYVGAMKRGPGIHQETDYTFLAQAAPRSFHWATDFSPSTRYYVDVTPVSVVDGRNTVSIKSEPFAGAVPVDSTSGGTLSFVAAADGTIDVAGGVGWKVF